MYTASGVREGLVPQGHRSASPVKMTRITSQQLKNSWITNLSVNTLRITFSKKLNPLLAAHKKSQLTTPKGMTHRTGKVSNQQSLRQKQRNPRNNDALLGTHENLTPKNRPCLHHHGLMNPWMSPKKIMPNPQILRQGEPLKMRPNSALPGMTIILTIKLMLPLSPKKTREAGIAKRPPCHVRGTRMSRK